MCFVPRCGLLFLNRIGLRLSVCCITADDFEGAKRMARRWFTLPVLIAASAILLAAAKNDCVFLKNPDEFMLNTERLRKANSDLTSRIAMSVSSALSA